MSEIPEIPEISNDIKHLKNNISNQLNRINELNLDSLKNMRYNIRLKNDLKKIILTNKKIDKDMKILKKFIIKKYSKTHKEIIMKIFFEFF